MQKFVDSVNSNEQAYQQLADWGLELDQDTIAVSSRVMQMQASTNARMVRNVFNYSKDKNVYSYFFYLPRCLITVESIGLMFLNMAAFSYEDQL